LSDGDKMEGMKAYSQDLRERILQAVDDGMQHKEIVRIFRVSAASIGRYVKQRREEGHVRPKAIPGRPSQIEESLRQGLTGQLKAKPDATLDQHCQEWEDKQGVPVSRWSMSRAIKALGWTRKKKHWEPASEMRTLEKLSESRSRG
jgi:transposase